MNEVVDQIAARTGISPDIAERAVGMMLGFLQREAPDGAVSTMIGSIPGASDLVAQYNGAETGGGGGLLGSIMSAVGAGGGIMALGQELMSHGLGMSEISSLAKETIAVARQYAGDTVVDEVVGSIPGLGQFL